MDTDRLLLIVEDDEAFARTLARSFERRGYQVLHAEGIARMEELLAVHTPQYAVVDLKLKGEANGLACVRALHAHSPSSIKTLEWERIHEVLAESDFNISEAARRLGMHRRTLSRKLGKQRV